MNKKKPGIYRHHTIESRQLARIETRLIEKQRVFRNKWLDADVELGAIRYKIASILRRKQ